MWYPSDLFWDYPMFNDALKSKVTLVQLTKETQDGETDYR